MNPDKHYYWAENLIRERHRREFGDRCGAKNGVYVCTKKFGHEGQHMCMVVNARTSSTKCWGDFE